ncbi:Methylthioribulose-1-Phosphate Dehydratase [Manis pentadactyla]|nr:Methylthioribulose-1-Phosphate Dehydratase [Manis pentadactyla]
MGWLLWELPFYEMGTPYPSQDLHRTDMAASVSYKCWKWEADVPGAADTKEKPQLTSRSAHRASVSPRNLALVPSVRCLWFLKGPLLPPVSSPSAKALVFWVLPYAAARCPVPLSLECPGTRSLAPWGDTGAISLISSLDRVDGWMICTQTWSHVPRPLGRYPQRAQTLGHAVLDISEALDGEDHGWMVWPRQTGGQREQLQMRDSWVAELNKRTCDEEGLNAGFVESHIVALRQHIGAKAAFCSLLLPLPNGKIHVASLWILEGMIECACGCLQVCVCKVDFPSYASLCGPAENWATNWMNDLPVFCPTLSCLAPLHPEDLPPVPHQLRASEELLQHLPGLCWKAGFLEDRNLWCESSSPHSPEAKVNSTRRAALPSEEKSSDFGSRLHRKPKYTHFKYPFSPSCSQTGARTRSSRLAQKGPLSGNSAPLGNRACEAARGFLGPVESLKVAPLLRP